MTPVGGIHHVTCIARDPQANLDFYSGVLGMRLVKRSVNQDDPGTYHLFYADGAGRPGSDLTFFPWPNAAPGVRGTGLTDEVVLAVPMGTLADWRERLERYGVDIGAPEERFGESALPLRDPDGLRLALTETADQRDFTPWSESPVSESMQVRRIHEVRLWERSLGATAELLMGAFGFSELGAEAGWHRFGPGPGGSSRMLAIRAFPDVQRGHWGAGTVHHVAWRVADDETQMTARQRVAQAGARPTEVIDRFWFRSVYFREPGGVLFELATDGPGFTVDEDPERLGERLILPPWLEARREQIEAALPPLSAPDPTTPDGSA